MMLGRLQMDCEYFLGHGNRNEKHLWAGNVKDQLIEIDKLWEALPDEAKPEFLTPDQIEDYKLKMNA
jgi:hypothetical protein